MILRAVTTFLGSLATSFVVWCITSQRCCPRASWNVGEMAQLPRNQGRRKSTLHITGFRLQTYRQADKRFEVVV